MKRTKKNNRSKASATKKGNISKSSVAKKKKNKAIATTKNTKTKAMTTKKNTAPTIKKPLITKVAEPDVMPVKRKVNKIFIKDDGVTIEAIRFKR